MPSAIAGSLHPSNKDAISINNKGLIALGTQSLVTIYDIHTCKILQVLDEHTSAVNIVSWTPEASFIRQNEVDPKLVSTDITGQIIIWDVFAASIISKFKNNNTTVKDLKWIVWQDANRDFLLTLHSSDLLILWNTDNGEIMWEYKFSRQVFKIVEDSLEIGNFYFTTASHDILQIKNIGINNKPNVNPTVISILQPINSQESIITNMKCHRAFPNIIFIITYSELLCYDIASNKILYKENINNIIQILPCAERDAFFLVHSDGMVSFKAAKIIVDEDKDQTYFTYEKICQSESSRPNPKNKIISAEMCNVTENTITIVYNTGKVLNYQLSLPDSKAAFIYRTTFLTDSVKIDDNLHNSCFKLSLIQSNQFPTLSHSPTVIRVRSMQDVDIETDLYKGKQLVAVGTNSGSIFLIDAFDFTIIKEFKIHNSPVKCLEFNGANSIISASYSAALTTSAYVKNYLYVWDIQTGVKKALRSEIEESPIRMLRVSHYHCYVALCFQNEPLEIWDLKNLKLLRRMSKSCPLILDMAWSCKHHKLNVITSEMNVYKENLVVLDNENHLFHVVVKGLQVRDGKEVSTDWKRGSCRIRCMVWKDDLLAYADTNNKIGVWDLNNKKCREARINDFGPIVKMIFSKLCGDNSLTVVHSNGVAIWDVCSMKIIRSFTTKGSMIIDCDLSGTTPIYITTDSTVKMADYDNMNKVIHPNDRPILFNMAFIRKLKVIPSNFSTMNEIKELFKENFGNDIIDRIEKMDQTSAYTFILKFVGDTDAAKLFAIIESSIHPEKVLPPCLLLFWPEKIYKRQIEERLKILINDCTTKQQLERNIEWAIVLGKNDLASQLLLDTTMTSDENSRFNAYRACLLSANFNSESCQCFIKLVAMNMIASGHINDGIQMLFLIDQGLDACRHLQLQGNWLQSVLYAKANNKIEVKEVIKKFADQLLTENLFQKSLAIKLYASIQYWHECVEALLLSNDIKLAEAIKDITCSIQHIDGEKNCLE
uniref:WD_REPEATS_REGION domain-containing protein n=1 Tax=Parastrongyloides trichosuri TaxID=131310 RepID=A0A0N4ZN59_PARTI